jgi:hypothetical protein
MQGDRHRAETLLRKGARRCHQIAPQSRSLEIECRSGVVALGI